MKKTVYDFSKAVKQSEEWYTPSALSDMLKTNALKLATLKDEADIVPEMQCVVLSACMFLDSIETKEVEQ